MVGRVIDTKNMATVREWGILGAIYIDGREVRNGPRLPCAKLKKRIEKAARRLR